jgi:dihydrofolate synthase/folylpolyglutamate synthase
MGVEVAVVEAGMGGRSDATNVFETPELTLVTAIGIDHALWLGHDLPTVARDKAGIFRPGVAAMTTATGEALDALRAEAARVGAPFTAVRPLAGTARPEGGWDVELADGPATLALSGAYQLENAALVVAGLGALCDRGWSISPEAVRRGLASVAWPGRLETLTDDRGGQWLLDAAHNPAAVAALVSAWQAPEVAVFGVQRTKDGPAMASLLARHVRSIVVVPVPDAESWTAEALGVPGLCEAEDLEGAIALAERLAPSGLRVVTGSIYLVGAARARLLRRS